MANKVLTFVIDTLEPELDSVLAAAINEIHNLGHKIKEIRVADDAGETKVPVNTVAGVTVPQPVPEPVIPEPVIPDVQTPVIPEPVIPDVQTTP